jgi:hypothetical protein
MNDSIHNFLNCEDPLSEEITLNSDNEQEWLEITKDFLSFSNSYGGYLIFGVEDGSFKVKGLTEESTNILTNTNLIKQKINRFIEPPIELIRSKSYETKNGWIVVIYIPESRTVTHVISKDGSFKYPSGKSKIFLYKGSIFVRKSAGNKLASSRDIDEIVNKRLEYFRTTLLNKIAKVVEAPTSTEVLIISTDETDQDTKKFVIEDAPDAIPIKGMSFTTAPQTTEQEIAGWNSMHIKSSLAIPPVKSLWKYYYDRENISLSSELRISLVKFSVIQNVPFFYWLQDRSAVEIKKMIDQSLHEIKPRADTAGFFKLATFLGKFPKTCRKSIAYG